MRSERQNNQLGKLSLTVGRLSKKGSYGAAIPDRSVRISDLNCHFRFAKLYSGYGDFFYLAIRRLVGIGADGHICVGSVGEFVAIDSCDAEKKIGSFKSNEECSGTRKMNAGLTFYALRQAGFAGIESHRVDVVFEGDLIEAGVPVVVSRVDGNRIVVRRHRVSTEKG